MSDVKINHALEYRHLVVWKTCEEVEISGPSTTKRAERQNLERVELSPFRHSNSQILGDTTVAIQRSFESSLVLSHSGLRISS
jgi:hypothetical protein